MPKKKDLDPNTDLQTGVLDCARIHVSLGIGSLENLCRGYGTFACVTCSFADFIPDTCLILQNKKYISKGSDQIECLGCDLVCPCNKHLYEEEVEELILLYEMRR